MAQASVLVVEDNELERQITADTLRDEGFAVEEAAVGKRAMELLALSSFDVVLTDLMMPGMSGEELLTNVKARYAATQVVVLTAHGTIDSAVKAIKNGAFYYLTKPTDREALVMTVGKAAELANLQQENQLLRTARPFVAINCSAIPDNLIENELFGHERGAFTGATERKIGLIESADKSTLFLDEIADLGFSLQAKILRVLQEREVRRVGGNESFHVDVRLIAATNRNLAEEVGEGRFREDLYYRVNVVTITLPPLRDRRPDIPLLANHTLARFSHLSGGRVNEISREAMEVLLDYSWPGNVRQLESAIERAILLCEGDTIMPRDLPQEVLSRKTPGRMDLSRGDRFEIPSEGLNFEHFERDLILQAMEKSDWIIAKAAKMLGMSYRTLQYRLDKFGLKKPEGKSGSPAEAKP